jgi:hypothetical protein
MRMRRRIVFEKGFERQALNVGHLMVNQELVAAIGSSFMIQRSMFDAHRSRFSLIFEPDLSPPPHILASWRLGVQTIILLE